MRYIRAQGDRRAEAGGMQGPGMRRTIGVVAAGCLLALAHAAPGIADPLDGAPLLGDVVHYVQLGPTNHLTGSSSDQATQTWMRDELAAAGLQTGVDAYDYYGFVPNQVGLSVAGTGYANITPYFYSGVTGPSPVTAPTVYAGVLGSPVETQNQSLAGKIAVIDVPYIKQSTDSSFAN